MDHIHLFGECDDPLVVGGKGASLSRMVKMGLPVPPGFTVSTAAWRQLRDGKITFATLMKRVHAQLKAQFPDLGQGTLVSIRSGAPVSMPGMMDTVLNVGLNPADPADATLALNLYRSLAKAVGVDPAAIDDAVDAVLLKHKRFFARDLPPTGVAQMIAATKSLVGKKTSLPKTPLRYVDLAARLVLDSWNSERAVLYRQTNGISEDLGTAINVQRMVYGTKGGAGVMLTRDPQTGEAKPMIDWMAGHQGDTVVDGSGIVEDGAALGKAFPQIHQQLLQMARMLEWRYGDAMDIEFTVDSGKLYVLQCRPMKRAPTSRARIAVEMYHQGLMPAKRVTGLGLVAVPPAFAVELAAPSTKPVSKGTPVIGRLVRGTAAFQKSQMTEDAVLFRSTTTPDDLDLMLEARAIVTTTGGPTCHAALVAREFNIPTIVSAAGVILPTGFKNGGTLITAGAPVTLLPDGRIFLGHLEVVEKAVPDPWHERLAALQGKLEHVPQAVAA